MLYLTYTLWYNDQGNQQVSKRHVENEVVDRSSEIPVHEENNSNKRIANKRNETDKKRKDLQAFGCA